VGLIAITGNRFLVWGDEMLGKGNYSATIDDTLNKNGADCHVETYSVLVETASVVIFSIKCSSSSYLKDIEVTCTQSATEKCSVSSY
jgi:hypothetical protein